MAASIQFSVGDKCYFHIDGKRMTGEIAALSVKPGQHSVSLYCSYESERVREGLVHNLMF